MATEPLGHDAARIPGDSQVSHTAATEARAAERIPDRTEAIDAIQALLDLGEEPDFTPSASLAEQLLAWIAPRPRNPATLTQSRIVPLLSVAADMLSRAADSSGEIVGLGATALAQELRMQRALADRRATLIVDNGR
jgi:hypothetical protein